MAILHALLYALYFIDKRAENVVCSSTSKQPIRITEYILMRLLFKRCILGRTPDPKLPTTRARRVIFDVMEWKGISSPGTLSAWAVDYVYMGFVWWQYSYRNNSFNHKSSSVGNALGLPFWKYASSHAQVRTGKHDIWGRTILQSVKVFTPRQLEFSVGVCPVSSKVPTQLRCGEIYSGLRFDVMNKLNARGGLFVGQKAAAAAGAHNM